MGKISELIEELRTHLHERGDIEVVNAQGDYVTLSYDDGDDGNNPAIVIE